MSHRVIAGTAKGTRLKMVPGSSTRPITDRAKEALFSILGSQVMDMRVLDLFAGTGAVGIEALSRGAESVTFLDRSWHAIQTVEANVEAARLTDGADIVQGDAFEYIEGDDIDPYTMVYIAPPQYQGLWKRALHALDAHPDVLEPDAIVIVQIDPKEQEALTLEHLRAYDERVYGSTLLWFFDYEAELTPGEMRDE